MAKRCGHELTYLYREPKGEALRRRWLLELHLYWRCMRCGRVASVSKATGRLNWRCLTEVAAGLQERAAAWNAAVAAEEGAVT